jgi:hypothetical protein
VPSEPFDLGAGVPVDDIAFIVLEAPGDEDVALANPDLLLDLALDPAHAGDPVVPFHGCGWRPSSVRRSQTFPCSASGECVPV